MVMLDITLTRTNFFQFGDNIALPNFPSHRNVDAHAAHISSAQNRFATAIYVALRANRPYMLDQNAHTHTLVNTRTLEMRTQPQRGARRTGRRPSPSHCFCAARVLRAFAAGLG